MANNTIYPFGPGGQTPAGIPIVNDLVTGGADKALSAEQGVVLKGMIDGGIDVPVYGYLWKAGTLDTYHKYSSNSTTRICIVFPAETKLSFVVASGYYASIHCYAQVFTDVTQITSGSSWLGNIDNGWKSGSVSVDPITGTKSYYIVVKKGDAGTSTVGASEGYSAITDIKVTNSFVGEVQDLEANGRVVKLFHGTWKQGSLTNNVYNGSVTNRIITTFPCSGTLSVSIASGYMFALHSYSEVYEDIEQVTNSAKYIAGLSSGGWLEGEHTFQQPNTGKTFVIIIKRSNDSAISPSDSDTAVLSLNGTALLLEEHNALARTVNGYDLVWQSEKPTITWRQGSLDNGHAYYSGMNTRIITAIAWVGDLNITVGDGYFVSVHCYSKIITDIANLTSGSGWLGNIDNEWKSGSVHVSQLRGGLTYVLIVKKGSAGTESITPAVASTAITNLVGDDVHYEGLEEKVNDIDGDTGNYVWGADFIKRNVKVTQIGTLRYLQAFCVYDGKYYSTSGSAIAEQDAQFTTLRDVSINVGHGNSLQLVSGGKAWASGWDDQKMYRVNLSTLVVDQTLTLPTTGYTTVAVNEDNGVMYIFQRSSYPSTVAQYNFITYDYVNGQILSTRKIESFAAMQAVDYYQGKIVILFGFGTSAAPSGMRVYNTNGDVLADFYIDVLADNEPEGVMFERDKNVLLISDVDKKVYKIE